MTTRLASNSRAGRTVSGEATGEPIPSFLRRRDETPPRGSSRNGVHTGGSQSEVPRPAGPALPGNASGRQVLRVTLWLNYAKAVMFKSSLDAKSSLPTPAQCEEPRAHPRRASQKRQVEWNGVGGPGGTCGEASSGDVPRGSALSRARRPTPSRGEMKQALTGFRLCRLRLAEIPNVSPERRFKVSLVWGSRAGARTGERAGPA